MKAKTQTIEGFCAYHHQDGWCWPTFMLIDSMDILLSLGDEFDEYPIDWKDDQDIAKYWLRKGWKIKACKMTLEGELEE